VASIAGFQPEVRHTEFLFIRLYLHLFQRYRSPDRSQYGPDASFPQRRASASSISTNTTQRVFTSPPIWFRVGA
jgi:hypothetical protein